MGSYWILRRIHEWTRSGSIIWIHEWIPSGIMHGIVLDSYIDPRVDSRWILGGFMNEFVVDS